jgi:hypothetical protein
MTLNKHKLKAGEGIELPRGSKFKSFKPFHLH